MAMRLFSVGRLISGMGAVLLNVLVTKMTTDWFVGREIGTALALLVSSWPIGIGIALNSPAVVRDHLFCADSIYLNSGGSHRRGPRSGGRRLSCS